MLVTCRADNCGMQFANSYVQKQHESLMHKNLLNDTVEKILTKILTSHTDVDLQKKVFYIGTEKVSYQEISKMDRDSEKFEQVRISFINITENWLKNNPEKNIGDFLRTVKFRVSGK